MSYSSFSCVSVVPAKIMQAGTRGHSLQQEQFSLQRDIAGEKAESARYNEVNIRCNENVHKGTDRKYSLQRDPKPRSVQKS